MVYINKRFTKHIIEESRTTLDKIRNTFAQKIFLPLISLKFSLHFSTIGLLTIYVIV